MGFAEIYYIFACRVQKKNPGKDRLNIEMIFMKKVKNVVGSGWFGAPSGYSSWLEYWERKTNTKKYICGVSGRSNSNLVGAHVQKVNSNDKNWYITPLCKSCNQRTDEFDAYWELVPIPSNL